MNTQQTYEGVLMVRGRGFGFFRLPNQENDVFIPTERLGFALDGDIVEIKLESVKPGERPEGTVLRVIEPARKDIIGTVHQAEDDPGVFYLQPDDNRIHVRPRLPKADAAAEGMKVVIEITVWEDPQEPPQAEITDTIGRAGEHETEMQAIIRGGGFAQSFPAPVAKAGRDLYENRDKLFAAAIEDTKGEKPTRRDLRDRLTMTIDPKDAKDFDDALSFHPLPEGGFEIGIHIADVSHYVKEGDAIDREATERGTSIYLVDRVIPMLPEVLSNDLCSLRPNEDRLAFSAIFEMDDAGNISKEWYGQTIIHSDRRFTYEDAQTILDKGQGEHYDALKQLMNIGRQLRQLRYKNGAIAFEQPEVRFELDENGRPLRAYAKERVETMLMVEDFMLLANRKVSEYIYQLTKTRGRDAAFIYRIHDVPNPEKIEELALFIHALGYEFKTNKGLVSAKDINKLLQEIEGTPEENLIKTATIRSMAKAVYSTKNIGHFGLAFRFYTHFTSPIRRYPDLLAHRLLRKHLDGQPIGAKELARYENLAIQCSEREMRAVKAERDSIKYKQVEFMQDKIGQVFDGLITGVTDRGIYVQDKVTMAEGMVRLSTVKKDFLVYEADKYRLRGSRTGLTYALGDEVRMKLTRANLEDRQLDFEIVS